MKKILNKLYVTKIGKDILIVRLLSITRLTCDVMIIYSNHNIFRKGLIMWTIPEQLIPIKEYNDRIEIFNLICGDKNGTASNS
jgi:hypothetical protein